MPRYVFRDQDGGSLLAGGGMELQDLAAAKRAALRLVAERGEDDGFWSAGATHVTVADETGLVLFCLDLTATLSPVIAGGRALETHAQTA